MAREAEKARLAAAGIDPDDTIAEVNAGFVWGFGAPQDEGVLPAVREFSKVRECGWARTVADHAAMLPLPHR